MHNAGLLVFYLEAKMFVCVVIPGRCCKGKAASAERAVLLWGWGAVKRKTNWYPDHLVHFAKLGVL